MKWRAKTALALAWLTLAAPSLAADGAQALMQAVYDQGRQHQSQRMEMALVIRDAKGRERVRHFNMLYRITGEGETRSLLRFHKPSDIKGTGLFNIVYDARGKASDQWIYFPAFRRINKLSAEEKHQSFMGSDFTNADIAGRRPEDDAHRLLRADEEVSVVSSQPLAGDDPYSRIESHIINRIKVPKKALFYNRAGDLLKTLTARRIAKIDGMYTIMEAEMANHLSGGSTIMTKEAVNFDDIKVSQVVVSQLSNR